MTTTVSPTPIPPLNRRQRAILRAVATGRAEMTSSCEPDLFLDGLACCDQAAAHDLARSGHLRAAATGPLGCRVPAALTDLGRAALRA